QRRNRRLTCQPHRRRSCRAALPEIGAPAVGHAPPHDLYPSKRRAASVEPFSTASGGRGIPLLGNTRSRLAERQGACFVERQRAAVVVLRVRVRIELRERPSEPAVGQIWWSGCRFSPIDARTASLMRTASRRAHHTSCGLAFVEVRREAPCWVLAAQQW